MEGIKQVTGVEMEDFIFIAINNTKPFEVEFYPLNAVSIEQGDYMFREVLHNINSKKLKL